MIASKNPLSFTEMKLKNPTLFAAFLIISLVLSTQVLSQEVEDEKEFDYNKGSDKGPENWGKIHKNWSACGEGNMQSPIDLLDEKVEVLHHLGRLKRSYKASKAILKNRGHDIELEWENGAGAIYMNGTEYILKNCSLELHMVHESIDKKTAVVGILYKIGRPDTFLSELMGYIRTIADRHEAKEEVGIVDPRHIKLGSRKYYRYNGSLTTPPCTEGVIWTIIKKVRTVSREQVKLLRDAVHDGYESNARPTQPTNYRMDEKEFDYIKGSDKGPENWGKIHKNWSACGEGNMQSPIDLLDEKVEVLHHLGRLNRSYKASKATLKNRGHDIELEWENGAGERYMNGTEYILKQCHWHSPSEHTIDKLHMVHESIDKKIAVVGILYKIGRPDTFLSELMGDIRKIADRRDAKEEVGMIDPRHIKLGSRKYYRYNGSLTTPPCTEGVIWTIIKKVRTVSREQVKLLRDAVHDGYESNARPTQPTNYRMVHLYRPLRL
ncbi:alpha carbonic anhydrase 7-like protein [Cinnamomum micranthum f. kanehirae]|uniref:Alpha carbonic anhydrase 7-like protein n=1 Tax=Cinnamomum micranthum f. kanehirae TaxID=337451 RepID=A0A3S3MYT7_9MAGN|nr:alpha carbonic anhydrase 7-like protein [Cinnamomum micranthum f. kanehirae]